MKLSADMKTFCTTFGISCDDMLLGIGPIPYRQANIPGRAKPPPPPPPPDNFYGFFNLKK